MYFGEVRAQRAWLEMNNSDKVFVMNYRKGEVPCDIHQWSGKAGRSMGRSEETLWASAPSQLHLEEQEEPFRMFFLCNNGVPAVGTNTLLEGLIHSLAGKRFLNGY